MVAVQVKSVQDAIRDKKEIFNFMGEMIRCVPTVGIFITMVILIFHFQLKQMKSKQIHFFSLCYRTPVSNKIMNEI